MKNLFFCLCLTSLLVVGACTTTYRVQMGAVTSFNFQDGSTCREVLRDLGRPHQQIVSKRKGYVTWRYAFRVPSDKPKALQYEQYTFIFFQGRLRQFSNKRESYDFSGKGFRTQPVCPIQD